MEIYTINFTNNAVCIWCCVKKLNILSAETFWNRVWEIVFLWLQHYLLFWRLYRQFTTNYDYSLLVKYSLCCRKLFAFLKMPIYMFKVKLYYRPSLKWKLLFYPTMHWMQWSCVKMAACVCYFSVSEALLRMANLWNAIL